MSLYGGKPIFRTKSRYTMGVLGAGLRRLLVGADGGSINVFGPFCFDHSRLSGGIATFILKCLYTMGVLGAGPRCLLVAADAASRLSMMKSR